MWARWLFACKVVLFPSCTGVVIVRPPPKKVLKLLLFAPAKFRLRLWLVACKVMRFPSGAEVVVVLPPQKKLELLLLPGMGRGALASCLQSCAFPFLYGSSSCCLPPPKKKVGVVVVVGVVWAEPDLRTLVFSCFLVMSLLTWEELLSCPPRKNG